jgi:hypothetical protein
MTENGSDFLPFEPPEQENIRLREESVRLRRLLAAHSIPIPKLAPENPSPVKTIDAAPPGIKRNEPERESRCFEACFAEERMSTPGDGKTMTAGTDMCRRT